MPIEKSAGAVVFYRAPEGKIEYLLIENGLNKYWGFPKGWIGESENLETAALREVGEETGLKDLKLIDGFKETVRYFLKAKYDYQIEHGFKKGQTILKFVTYFLGESSTRNVKLSFEHNNFVWLEFKDAYKKLSSYSHKQNAEILKKGHDFLTQHFLSS